ncbi:MAG: hypothetical protein ACOH2S_13145 [Janthinobacterium svalbardensis]
MSDYNELLFNAWEQNLGAHEPGRFQRIGAESNAHVGRAFEQAAQLFFQAQGIHLQPRHRALVGVGSVKKIHEFDLGCDRQRVLVECKSHRWTTGSNIPSAKMTVWNEAMFYFLLAPTGYRKIMFVLRHTCERRGITLASYYLKNYSHLIPDDVEFWEYDEEVGIAVRTER